ncbi:hypothetical protein FA13DRAFT_1756569 [Coprinellus micaceus]|uniref:Yeast cell wall synthesis Kre9/Knh1-like N-terminal domain-containing protein n=1 Tax=Coprinellus micaceus TaxID=71717 RepID=A0A4Y7SV72_COPMI|nr:hypothetical protein FA13DRAFT_1756569 [Coprinellus micaceus]
MFAKTLIVLAIAAQAFSYPFITNPVATSTLSGGKEATITWIDNGQTPSLKDFGPAKVSIYAGNALQQTSLQTIAENVDVSTTGSVKFTVNPAIGPNSKEYFIRLESISLKDGQYPALAFSAKFTLDSMTGEFTPAVQSQIAGQSTAPLASQTSTPAGASKTTATGATTSAATTSKASAAAATTSAADNGAISAKAGWAGIIIGAVAGVALF